MWIISLSMGIIRIIFIKKIILMYRYIFLGTYLPCMHEWAILTSVISVLLFFIISMIKITKEIILPSS